MLGFEHPSHMVTHPSTDEAQCCLSLEILVNSSKKEEEEEERKKKVGSRVPSELRGLKKSHNSEGTQHFFTSNTPKDAFDNAGLEGSFRS